MHKAKKAKNDEFYTLYNDIETEVAHYKNCMKDKWIYCNCDSEKSNFWKYFVDNFQKYGLKRLTATHCEKSGTSYRLDYDGVDIIQTPLKQNGDFRSPECELLLQEADIVCTNPPFSLFREYIEQLMKYNKKFLVIGNSGAVTYEEIFKLIKDGKIYLGLTYPKEFVQPDKSIKKFGNIGWFTNLEIKKKPNIPILIKKYNPKDYPQYDNYQAINVNKVKDIPYDYNDVMGVPITILGLQYSDGYIHLLDHMSNEMRYEMIGKLNHKHPPYDFGKALLNGKELYARILIKKI